ncbi:thiamine pyrophosphate TPP-binding domain-containing protein [Amylibacter marinus]|uniref:Thiamine pyrophosphate TPP-binding domain-containing protein n=1 Tax=Amylibacter marinus TaxID=1475483 RepID=A0ABQ5VSX2_9RHOB|nr:thiamine pyrophosphate-binding protein [Amylibacter marinus]GLQ34213.1 thiamine pyrophosphate TPP-binding domain-containing protein [Amylibacter marinus]
MKKRAADLLVDCLVAQGVSKIFGVPGESYLSVLDALVDRGAIDFINTRNEGGAAFMAEAYGKLTGKAGICFVTRGPGATNASIGVHTARQNSSPMVLFIGQIAREMTDREAFQEIDYRAYFGPIAKWVTQIDDPSRIPEVLARAFQVAQSGRPGPVVVALPEDMLRQMTLGEATPQIIPLRPQAGSADIAAVHMDLSAAKRPLIIAGGGGWCDAGRRALKSYAEASKIPVITGFRNQDLIDNASAAYAGDAGFGKSASVKQLIQDADVILALNIRFGEVVTDGWTLFDVPVPQQKIIHVHLDPAEIGKIYHCARGINADPLALLAGLSAKAGGDQTLSSARSIWYAKAALGRAEARQIKPTRGALNMAKICTTLNTVMDVDAVITNGAGNFAIWPGRYLDYGGQRRLLAPQSGAMGAGLPAALAAKSAHPERQVICFAGDGDFQMNIQELGTAMQQGWGPIILLYNNGSYGTIRMHQERDYPDRISGTNLHNPNFKHIADAYGFGYACITDDVEFGAAFTVADQAAFGFLIEMVADPADIAPGQILAPGP